MCKASSQRLVPGPPRLITPGWHAFDLVRGAVVPDDLVRLSILLDGPVGSVALQQLDLLSCFIRVLEVDRGDDLKVSQWSAWLSFAATTTITRSHAAICSLGEVTSNGAWIAE